MSEKPKILTDKFIQSVRARENVVDYPDGQVPGLFLRIAPSGTKSWIFRYSSPISGTRRRQSLKHYPLISLAAARSKASKARQLIAEGKDPIDHAEAELKAAADQARRDAEKGTLGEAFTSYRQRRIDMKRDKALKDTDARWRRALSEYQHRKLDECDRAWVKRCYRDAGGADHKAEVVQIHILLKSILSHAVDEEMIPRHHMPNQAPYKLERREVVPTLEDLAAIWKACDQLPAHKARCVRMLMLSLKRRSETKDMQCAHIDAEKRVWQIPHTDTKKGTAEGVPLTDEMLAILTGKGVFEFAPAGAVVAMHPRTVSAAYQRARKHCGLDHLQLHDFRTGGATWLANHGTARADVSEVLGHTPPGVGGAHAAYDQARYTPGKRMALEKWNAALLAIVEGRKLDQDGNPVREGKIIQADFDSGRT